jgi:hypothetical protein
LAAAGMVLALLALWLCVRLFAPAALPGMTEANVDRLYWGMTLGQAEDLLGPPQAVTKNTSCTKVTWASDSADAQLFFNGPVENQGLTAVFMVRQNHVQEVHLRKPPLATVRGWIGW